jgi:gamma-butyrobetaine dioxygenase
MAAVSRVFSGVNQALRRVASCKRDDVSRLLNVKWTDGSDSKFAYAWLRDNAPEPHTYHFGKNNRARVMLMQDFDPFVKPSTVTVDNGNLQIDWDLEGKYFATYTAKWLEERDLTTEDMRQNRSLYHKIQTQSWGAENVKTEILDRSADWNEMMINDRYLRDKLVDFLSYGLMFVKNVPKEMDQLKLLNGRLGYIQPSHYGKQGDPSIFQVYAAPDPSNLHGTTQALGLHTDFPQMTQPPEVQILHAVRAAGTGGDSEFCDGFRVAELMKEEKPEYYQLLCKHPIEFVDHGRQTFKFQFASRWRTFTYDTDGEMKSVFFNNQTRSWFIDAPVEVQPKVYEALKCFHDYCYQPRSMTKLKLNAGEMVWFSNNRVMHGRSAFQMNPEFNRLLEGVYLSFDILKSTVRTISENLGEMDQASL